MATATKEQTVSVRITAAEKRSLEADARRKGIPTATVAAHYIAEGVRRSRFPAVEFRNGSGSATKDVADARREQHSGLSQRATAGRKTHGGVIYVSGGLRQNDSPAVIRALVAFLKTHGGKDWGVAKAGFKSVHALIRPTFRRFHLGFDLPWSHFARTR